MVIFLIGMMGVGKTSTGKELSELLGFDFYDLDHEIEKQVQRKIAHIFQQDGEQAFRCMEHNVLAVLQHKKNSVIATGGGLILNAKNREILKKSGVVVYLTATLWSLCQRLSKSECSNRPLILAENNQNKQNQINLLLKQRQKLYQETADIMIETDNKSIYCVAQEITKVCNTKV